MSELASGHDGDPAGDWRAGGFGVYVHWPFCMAKCPYCDFNSHVRAGGVDQAAWAEALGRDIAHAASLTGKRRVDSVFFGGGTPSLMDPATVAAVIDRIAQVWDLALGAEISLEANPTSVEAGRFGGYALAGVNRLSMGVQALNDGDLKALGRMHTAAEAQQAFDIAKKYFGNVSFDLIYARQGQTMADWQAELSGAIAMAVDHLSLYQLTIEAGTRFGELHARGRLRGLPGDALSADMYMATQDICGAAGLSAYEVSNHARPGAECAHNLVYWRYGDYAGIGPGAHGRLSGTGGRLATMAHALPEAWMSAVARQGHGLETQEALGGADQAVEYLLMSMRLAEGCDPARYARLAGVELPPDRVAALCTDGFVRRADGRLACTPAGRLVLNAILRELLA